ncbi:50S ribosomal protein L23 [Candidatus Falkowbacteria bacterium]|nr:50S ribosomal protein L23 [Candidatus Falkowbacteria bacterium]
MEKKEKKYGGAYRALIKPLITERASVLGALNKYVFEVAKGANKIEIAKAVNEVYGIQPVSVNIIRIKGKEVKHGRMSGRRKDWKKAIITLPAGESIKVYEGV